MLVESSAVEKHLSPGHRLHLTVHLHFSLFTDTNKKGCDWNTGLESKSPIIFRDVPDNSGRLATLLAPKLPQSVLTLAKTSASLRWRHTLTIKLAAHFLYLTIIKHGLTWK